MKFAKTLLKFAFVAVLMYFLISKGFISLERTKAALARTDLVVPAYLVLLLSSALGVVRWHWLLQAQGIRLKWSQTFQLTFIGFFFNIALPGAVSGDFVKAFYVANEAKGQKARAFGSILFDRLAGLSALVMVSAGALTIGIQSFLGTPLMGGIRVVMTLAAVAVIGFYVYLFLVKEHHDPLLRILRAMERKVPKVGSVTRIYEGTRHYHNHRLTVLKVLVLSIVIHIIVGSMCVLFLRALGDSHVDALPVFVVVPLGMLATAIPILPGGLGTGNAAFGGLFLLLGSQRGADVFSLFAISQFISGAIGGLIYLRYKSHAPKLIIPSTQS